MPDRAVWETLRCAQDAMTPLERCLVPEPFLSLRPVGDVPGLVVEGSRRRPPQRRGLGVGEVAADQRDRDVRVDGDVVHLDPDLPVLLWVLLDQRLLVQPVVLL